MIKAFDKWDCEGVKVQDPGLVDYITLVPKIVPKTGARYAGNRFHKSRVFIVERFMNKLMTPGHKSKKHQKSSGHMTGQAAQVYDIMQSTLEIVERKTKLNPVQVLVTAIENGAPREEVVTIEYGGARYPKAVECAPQRRVDVSMRQMTQGAYNKSFRDTKKIRDALAEEIIAAYNFDNKSQAIAKKLELERQADSSR